MPVEVLESKLSATSSGDASGQNNRIYDSIEAAVEGFKANTNPTSIDSVGTRKTGPDRCAVIILYTA